jgi:DNA-binding beta-propeller fold protein YncE
VSELLARQATLPLAIPDRAHPAPAGAVWVASYLGDTLLKISPATNSIIGTVRLASEPNGIVPLHGYLWVAESGANELAVVRPS